jgi:hypothetical protein
VLASDVPALNATGTPKLDLIAIAPVDCEECADVADVIDAFKQAPTMTLTSDVILRSDDARAKELIKEYDIKRLPVVILKGDIATLPAEAPRVKDAVVIDQLSPPLYDLENETIVGVVDITLISAPKCSKCYNISEFPAQLDMMAVGIGDEKMVAYDSKEGAALVKKYNITRVPTAIMSEGISWYPQIAESWSQIGDVQDGNFILREVVAPYLDVTTGKVRGVVSATFLADKSCLGCYDPVVHEQILGGMGMMFESKATLDVADDEGKALVKKYEITAVPTIIVTGDTSAYSQLLTVWGQVGTQESDGALVFRKPEVLQVTYKDLASGKIVEASPEDLVQEGGPIVVDAGAVDAGSADGLDEALDQGLN